MRNKLCSIKVADITLIDGESIVNESAFTFMCQELNLSAGERRYARAFVAAYEVARRNIGVKHLH